MDQMFEVEISRDDWFDRGQVGSGDNLPGRKRGPRCYFFCPVSCIRGSRRRRIHGETRKKFHLANPRYPYSTFGET